MTSTLAFRSVALAKQSAAKKLEALNRVAAKSVTAKPAKKAVSRKLKK